MHQCKKIKQAANVIRSFFLLALTLAGQSSAIADSCHALNAPKLVFSNFNPITSHHEDIASTIDFYCAPAFKGKKFSASILLQSPDAGSIFSMKNSVGDAIRFGIFSDPARSIPLGVGTTIPIKEINPDNKTFQVVLYGRILPNQGNVGVGNYQSSISLMVDY